MSYAAFEEAIRTIDVPGALYGADGQLHHRQSSAVDGSTQLESIVVPLDGTRFAEHAIPLAVAIARRSGCVITLVRAFTPSETATLHPGLDAFNVIEGQLRNEARRYLEDVQRRITEQVRDVTVVTHLAQANTIVDAVSRVLNSADLVVMATHGRGWLGRFFRGSVGRDLSRKSTRPILYVRGSNTPVDFSCDPVPQHMLIGLDGRKDSERSLEIAGLLARVTGARSTMLHVDDPHDAQQRFAHSTPEGYLHGARREFARTAPDVAAQVDRKAACPTTGILSFVENSGADLVVVTARTAPPALRSTTESLIRRSPVPVLMVPE